MDDTQSANHRYHQEDRAISEYENRLKILQNNIEKNEIALERARIDNEVLRLTALKNKLDNEDRGQHAALVRQQNKSTAQDQAFNHRKNTIINHEHAKIKEFTRI